MGIPNIVSASANGNTSGKGPDAQVPQDVANHFNWGAFLMTWIWGLGNKTYLPLIIIPVSFIPIINFIAPIGLSIWFGIKGNEWAWRNKEFESIEKFHDYQKLWIKIWAILFVVSIILGIMFSGAIMAYIFSSGGAMQ